MRESETVFEAVLTAAGRRDAVVAARMMAAQATMVEAMAFAERGRGRPTEDRPVDIDRPARPAEGGLNDPINDTVNDPINDRINAPVDPSSSGDLNPRQRWYLETLVAGQDVRAVDIRRCWGVSQKTAQRDVAGLRERGLIEFVGSPKAGRYRLRP